MKFSFFFSRHMPHLQSPDWLRTICNRVDKLASRVGGVYAERLE